MSKRKSAGLTTHGYFYSFHMKLIYSYHCYYLIFHITSTSTHCRAYSRLTLSQWETALLCNDVSHWLGARLVSAPYSLALLSALLRNILLKANIGGYFMTRGIAFCTVNTLRPRQNCRQYAYVLNYWITCHVWSSLYIDSNFTEFCFDQSSLVKSMDWPRTDDKTFFWTNDGLVYWHIQKSLGLDDIRWWQCFSIFLCVYNWSYCLSVCFASQIYNREYYRYLFHSYSISLVIYFIE